jgi:glycosyltransferase involved in cell wall biosynthesis
VHFLGYQTSERLRALYAGAHALIASSVCYEVFPLVLLEAFQLGVPVIARRLGAYPEIVEACGAGLMFQSRDELKAAIHTLATDKTVRDTMGKAAKRAFAARWSEDVALDAYLDLIRRIAEKRKIRNIQELFISE